MKKKGSESAHSWRGPHKIAAEDMRAKAVDARPGKTAFDKKTGAWGRRFSNRKADPQRSNANG